MATLIKSPDEIIADLKGATIHWNTNDRFPFKNQIYGEINRLSELLTWAGLLLEQQQERIKNLEGKIK